MDILLQRTVQNEHGTFSDVSINGQWFCYGLEPPNHGPHPDIPAGRYPLEILWSNRFQRVVPHVIDVPGRSNIEIHPGNVSTETEGCILLGQVKTDYEVLASRAACDAFQKKLADGLAFGDPVYLTVLDISQTATA